MDLWLVCEDGEAIPAHQLILGEPNKKDGGEGKGEGEGVNGEGVQF